MEGECHFLEGNIRAKKWVQYAKRLLEEVGIEPERLEMYNMSSSMATAFVQAVEEMTERAQRLGPNPLKKKGRGHIVREAEGAESHDSGRKESV